MSVHATEIFGQSNHRSNDNLNNSNTLFNKFKISEKVTISLIL